MAQEETNKTADTESVNSYKSSSWYDAETVDALKKQLDGYSTDYDTLKKQAEAEYNPGYQSELTALKNQLAGSVQAAQSERDALGMTFDRQRRLTNAGYDESAVKLNNTLTARGLGRSSLVSTQGGYLENKRNQALGDIADTETSAVDSINSRIAQLTESAARSEQTMANNYASQLESRINSLKNANQSASVNLQLQIAALQHQGYEAYQSWLLKDRAQSLDEAEYRQKYGLDKVPSASSSSSSAAKSATATASAPATTGTSALSSLTNALKNLFTKSSGTSAAKSTSGASLTGDMRNIGPVTKTVSERRAQ